MDEKIKEIVNNIYELILPLENAVCDYIDNEEFDKEIACGDAIDLLLSATTILEEVILAIEY